MNKIVYTMWIACVCVTMYFYTPAARGAELYSTAVTKQVRVGDTVVVDVRLNTEGKQLNAVEGILHVQGDVVRVSDISVGGSVLTLWPRTPVAEATSHGTDIAFTGGVPGGFTQSDGLLFKVVLTAEKSGKVVMQPEHIVSYENDGRGTKILASTSSLTLTVSESSGASANSWERTVISDSTPPEPFTISLGQNPSVYDDKKFISFNTTDAESGIDYYEIAEGLRTPVRAGSPYVLQDQEARARITVTAYDKAGNTVLAAWEPERATPFLILYIGIALGTLCILIVLALIVKRRRKTK